MQTNHEYAGTAGCCWPLNIAARSSREGSNNSNLPASPFRQFEFTELHATERCGVAHSRPVLVRPRVGLLVVFKERRRPAVRRFAREESPLFHRWPSAVRPEVVSYWLSPSRSHRGREIPHSRSGLPAIKGLVDGRVWRKTATKTTRTRSWLPWRLRRYFRRLANE